MQLQLQTAVQLNSHALCFQIAAQALAFDAGLVADWTVRIVHCRSSRLGVLWLL